MQKPPVYKVASSASGWTSMNAGCGELKWNDELIRAKVKPCLCQVGVK